MMPYGYIPDLRQVADDVLLVFIFYFTITALVERTMPAEQPFGAPVDAPSDIVLSMAMVDRPPTGTDLQ